MIDDDTYTFHIDAYSPETIPMSRLAEYMAALADLYGERDSVHFLKLLGGSTRILSKVEREASPKVRTNLSTALAPDLNASAAKAFKKLNDMLRDDNADADLSRDGSNVLAFPGRKIPRPPKLGPFNQSVERDGVLVRIGGKDKSAHASIEDGDGNLWSFEVTRELAKELAHHLFAKPIRLIGTGRWFRDEEGNWQHSTLKAHEFRQINADSLADVVARIRRLPEDTWNLGADPIASLRSLRGDDDGVH